MHYSGVNEHNDKTQFMMMVQNLPSICCIKFRKCLHYISEECDTNLARNILHVFLQLKLLSVLTQKTIGLYTSVLFAPFWKIRLPEKEIKYLHNLETNASGKKT